MHRARALVGTAFRTTALMMLVVIPVLLLGGLFVLLSTRTALHYSVNNRAISAFLCGKRGRCQCDGCCDDD